MRQDYKAILDLLAAFGIPAERVQSVVIHADLDSATTVHVEHLVFGADPEWVQRSYEVTAREVEA